MAQGQKIASMMLFPQTEGHHIQNLYGVLTPQRGKKTRVTTSQKIQHICFKTHYHIHIIDYFLVLHLNMLTSIACLSA